MSRQGVIDTSGASSAQPWTFDAPSPIRTHAAGALPSESRSSTASTPQPPTSRSLPPPAGMNTSSVPALYTTGRSGVITTEQPATAHHNALVAPADRSVSEAPHRSASTTSGALAIPRYSDLQSQLVALDREVASLREDNAVRAAECSMLKSALQREHETNLRMQTKHGQEVDQLRTDYDKQCSHLMDQLAVLKLVSDNAVTERKRVVEDAASRKAQMMTLLEKEREEKSVIMADYRQQTEQLISEQGREISTLRGMLEVARSEEEKLLQAAEKNEERRAELEAHMLRSENALMDERAQAQRRQREGDVRHQAEIDAHRHRFESTEQEWNETRQRLLRDIAARDDQLRIVTEKAEAYERDSEADRTQLRQHYEAAIERLTTELKRLVELKDGNETTMRTEMERLSRGDEKLILSLRQEVEKARTERHAAAEEARSQREALLQEHQGRMAQLQDDLAESRSETAEERAVRKDLESSRHSLTIRAETLQAANTRLTHELERLTVESRAKERQAEQEGQNLAEQLRGTIRSVEAENAHLRQQHKTLEIQAGRALDDSSTLKHALESLRSESRMEGDRLRAALDHANRQIEAMRGTHQKTIDSMQSQRLQLESDLQLTLRAKDESESRLGAAQKQLTEERKALEGALSENHELRTTANEARIALDSERVRLAATNSSCQERDAVIQRRQDTIVALEQRLQEAQQTADNAKEERDIAKRAAAAAASDIEHQYRSQIQTLEDQLTASMQQLANVRDQVLAADQQVHQCREEAAHWQRECLSREQTAMDQTSDARDEMMEECRRMEGVIASLRDDLTRAQTQKIAAQREVAEVLHESQRRSAIIQENLDSERQSKHRILEEIRSKDQLIAEMQGNVRLLSTRLSVKDEESRRLDADLNDTSTKLHDAKSLVGKKEAIVGQLMARLRVYEARSIMTSSSS